MLAAETRGRAKKRFRRTFVGTQAELRRAKTFIRLDACWKNVRRESHSHKHLVDLLGQYADGLDRSFSNPSSTAEGCPLSPGGSG